MKTYRPSLLPNRLQPLRWIRRSLLVASLFLSGIGSHAATVILDAGHGGADSGTAPKRLMAEKTATLDVARKVASKLKAAGISVVMTRNSDTFVELSDRIDISNRTHGKAVFVSLHFNSSPNRSSSGVETYFYSQRSTKLAESIHYKLTQTIDSPDRGVRSSRFYVLRYNKHPAALVELGFLSNSREGTKISRSEKHRQKLADAVTSGIRAALR